MRYGVWFREGPNKEYCCGGNDVTPELNVDWPCSTYNPRTFIAYPSYRHLPPHILTDNMAAPPPGAKRRHTTDKKLGERRRERAAGSSRDASEEGE